MRNKFVSLQALALLVIFCLTGSLTRAAVNPKPFVVPELKQWTGKDGNFTPGKDTRIVCTSQNPELLRIARMFADDYQQMFGQTLSVAQGKATSGDFVLSLSADKKLGEEGYAIKITDRVAISAPTPTGLYWSTRTLLQLAEQNQERSLPQGTIRDYPDYPLRGFMIDCGRKFIPMAYLQDLVKIMAYYKMNTLQVHLNDNGFKQYFEHNWDKTYAAFRLESETYPGLTARDGSYSKKEFIDFQKQAASNFVEIIPEIDVPAHSLALTHYKPEIGSKEYGMDHLDLFKPETYEFVDALFKEYLEGDNPVFVGKRVHIGTDEYSNAKKDVVEKFRAFTDHYIRFVEGFGKQAVVWGALSHAKGDTPVKSENVVMNAWYNGYADPATMIKDGYQLISIPDGLVYIVPKAGYYYDYLNEPYLYKEWTPAHIGKAVFDEKHPSILGGMFAIWNDHVGNGISVKDIHHRIFSPLQTLSVKMWTGAQTGIPYETFNEKRALLSEAPGVNQLARIGKKPELVYERSTVAPGSTSDYPEIGYNYTVSFDITGAKESEGTELFRSPNAVFYLSDPIRGMMGFARDGYLNTFPYKVNPGEKATIQIEGNNRSTTLRVNGKVVDEMNTQKLYFNAGKDSMNYVRTLVFPLEKAGNFNSKVQNLKVYNYCVSKP
ncbi:family 20 glycosylhydrolase [Bacteroides thetaiotaomicron]|uniref:Beta-N-hexosaminidase, glycosyl hyrolase family 20 n=1 Tax=Bacteroides thetaiotaomicron (strain ATCC 29148 / DSM 2079 / JCM 5827 / CCUG 10774 / NCTC 10582 / VPI-5482 / E50) TaxID=226186 RepID=Q8A103_BACTN|nr:family 20 glycosylhydrolase [Bacteroides thetaiotaomicron]AAO78973.1 beta-N-hexosaminidase, glycosyl hyrolase family 20 [Bacteroides thetaiotaomicron VPI-5482]MBI0304911.1 family 20 glycosylhydrolase [Bacteroides thetaiotaomicron]MBM6519616.1 family 20 glycosylhydrolase [Bacteroides thetaiotaomicron]MBV4309896.1 family 20 glycosylhydrolase [Bacteroides thetaiotaomicron]MBV4326776.1 family 20 glycosylhydrolase [Bacteroides thetaiotaomicron]